MRIAVATAFATGVGVWKRLADEGSSVRVWRGSEKQGSPELLTSHRRVGEGIVPLCDSWYELLAWCREGARSGEPTLMFFDSSGLGKQADEARRAGVHVIGGGTFCDRLEKDRPFGRKIAESVGIESPPFVEFSSIDDTIAFARSGALDRPVYFKSNSYIDGDATHKAETPEELVEYLAWVKTRARNGITNILEEKIDGAPLSTARWWNGRAWTGRYEGTLEKKPHMAGDVGPSTGCSLNAVFLYDGEPEIARSLNWEALSVELLRNECPPCLLDINAIVSDGDAYYLEWTPRCGWDSEGTSLPLLYDDLPAWLWHVATGTGDGGGLRSEIAVSVRLTVPPAPWEHGQRDEKGSAVGVPVNGDTGSLWAEGGAGFVGYELMQTENGLAVAAPEALVGLSAARGDALSSLAEDVVEFAKKRLRVPGLQYRIDVGEAIKGDAEAIADNGFGDDLPAGLFE